MISGLPSLTLWLLLDQLLYLSTDCFPSLHPDRSLCSDFQESCSKPTSSHNHLFSRDYEFNGFQSLNFGSCDFQNLNHHPSFCHANYFSTRDIMLAYYWLAYKSCKSAYTFLHKVLLSVIFTGYNPWLQELTTNYLGPLRDTFSIIIMQLRTSQSWEITLEFYISDITRSYVWEIMRLLHMFLFFCNVIDMLLFNKLSFHGIWTH